MDNYELTANRLKTAMSDIDINAAELVRRSGVLKSSISQFVHARGRPSDATAKRLGDALGVNPLWLLGYNVPKKSGDVDPFATIPNLSTPAARGLPILGEICAGNGIDCQENFRGLFFVDNTIRADYCLEVRGDSMIGANIFDGDVAFIQKSNEFHRGRIYAVLISGENNASLKRVYEQGDNLILSPCNPDYDPVVCRKLDVILIGECTGSFHKQQNATGLQP